MDQVNGKPCYERGQAPKHLLTANQLEQQFNMRPRSYGDPEAWCRFGPGTDDVFKLYDVRGGVPIT
jgi:hypothetical protein